MKVLLFVLALLALVLAAMAWFTLRTARRIGQLLPPTGRFVDVPGARLHVRESGCAAGTAPTLLLVHGLAGNMAHFDYGVAEELGKRWHVVAVDRPGSGHSVRAPGVAADVSTQAAALAALIAKLGLERPTVVGHSMGGAVGLALALEHRHAVGALALVAPLTQPRKTPPAVFRPLDIRNAPLRKLIAYTLALPGGLLGTDKVLAAVFAPERAPADFAVKGGGLLGLRPRQFLGASADLQAAHDGLAAIAGRYAELALPVGVLYGREDALLDWRAHGQALVDQAPGAWLEAVEGGHMLPVTQPLLTAAFVERVARRAGMAAGGA